MEQFGDRDYDKFNSWMGGLVDRGGAKGPAYFGDGQNNNQWMGV